MKIYGYCRVSTSEQAVSGMSLESQQQQITGYSMMKGWTVAEFFVEAGVSGSVPFAERPEGQRLLASLQAGDILVTARLDRTFRSASDALGTLEQLKEDKIGLHMIDLGGDVMGNGIGKLIFTILAAVAENARDSIRERVREAKAYRVSQQLYNGGKRPFGYEVANGSLIPNAHEQAALARGKALREEGASYRDVAQAWATEFNMATLDAKSIQRMLARA